MIKQTWDDEQFTAAFASAIAETILKAPIIPILLYFISGLLTYKGQAETENNNWKP